jgi:hypothetical protein
MAPLIAATAEEVAMVGTERPNIAFDSVQRCALLCAGQRGR